MKKSIAGTMIIMWILSTAVSMYLRTTEPLWIAGLVSFVWIIATPVKNLFEVN